MSDTSAQGGQPLHCIWVSFAEIYNERVFDLFETVQRGKKRKELKLYQDKEGRVYINGEIFILFLVLKLVLIQFQFSIGVTRYFNFPFFEWTDLTECCANTAEEAYQLFLAGKQNLHFASTQANTNSSRSHSFFNIRMVVIGKSGAYVYPKQVYR